MSLSMSFWRHRSASAIWSRPRIVPRWEKEEAKQRGRTFLKPQPNWMAGTWRWYKMPMFSGVSNFQPICRLVKKMSGQSFFPEIFIPQIWKFGPVIDLQQICVSLCQGSIKRLHFWSWKPLKPFTIVPVTFIKVKLYQQFDGDVEFNHGTPWSNVLGGFFSSLLLSGVLTLQGFGHKFSAKNGVTPLKTNTSPEK